MDVRAAIGVDEALWYLHRNLIRSQAADGTPGYFQKYAYADPNYPNRSYFLGATCAVIDAFQRHGSLAGNDWRTDPYVEDSRNGLNYILTNALASQIFPQVLGNGSLVNPDLNGNGIGIHIDLGASEMMYDAGLCAMTVAGSGDRNGV